MLLLILLILALLFGLGGHFYNDGAYRGPGMGLGGVILVIVLVLFLFHAF